MFNPAIDGDEANGFPLHGTREVDLGDAIGGEGAEETNFDAVVGEAAGDELVGLEVAFGGQWGSIL